MSYYRLNEFAKYVKYKIGVDSVLIRFQREIRYADSLIKVKDLKITKFEQTIIPAYQQRISTLQALINNNNESFAIREEEYKAEIKRQKNMKWRLIGVGGVFGAILAFFLIN